jgi:hypothetical protein
MGVTFAVSSLRCYKVDDRALDGIVLMIVTPGRLIWTESPSLIIGDDPSRYSLNGISTDSNTLEPLLRARRTQSTVGDMT